LEPLYLSAENEKSCTIHAHRIRASPTPMPQPLLSLPIFDLKSKKGHSFARTVLRD
jgi:hypothetical protein